jgi:ATP-dependent 26S proteasome regulatory subunit
LSVHEFRKVKSGVDRVSLRQAVIFICATNRPDELDLDFVRPGRIDRRLYIGLPDAEQRIKIFGVHSSGNQLAEDVNFTKVYVLCIYLVHCYLSSLPLLSIKLSVDLY